MSEDTKAKLRRILIWVALQAAGGVFLGCNLHKIALAYQLIGIALLIALSFALIRYGATQLDTSLVGQASRDSFLPNASDEPRPLGAVGSGRLLDGPASEPPKNNSKKMLTVTKRNA